MPAPDAFLMTHHYFMLKRPGFESSSRTPELGDLADELPEGLQNGGRGAVIVLPCKFWEVLTHCRA